MGFLSNFLSLEENPIPDVELPYVVTGNSYYVKSDPGYKYVYEMRRNGKVVYVGITGNPSARGGTYGGKLAKLRKNHNDGIQPSDEMILIEYLPVADARKREKQLIAYYGIETLANRNKGG